MTTKTFAILAAFALAACSDDAPSGGNSTNNNGSAWTVNNGNTNGAVNNASNNVANNSSTTGETPICNGADCTCPTQGKVLCGDICVDLSSDLLHCGRCDRDCGAASSCDSGICGCAAGAIQCGDRCADPSTDFNHCGECGNRCDNGEQCVAGICEPLMCAGSQVACRNGCVDLSSDAQNCGQCGRECFASESCVSGVCTCPPNDPACALVGNEGTLVGGACDAAMQCDTQCAQGGDFPNGTCTTGCQSDADCPGGTACIDTQGGICLLMCTDGDQCRNGYDCSNEDRVGGGETRVCING